MILENVSDEFLDWLDKCPNQWFLIKQTEDTLEYSFEKKGDEEDGI